METSELRSSEFWRDTCQQATVLANPRRDQNLQAVADAAEAISEIAGNVLVETSGSSGQPRFVCLSRHAISVSARAVNDHLRVESSDCWLCALPTFHVGGLMIYARGHAAGIEVVDYEKPWDSRAFCAAIDRSGATLTSLVPTQVVDLASAEMPGPKSLRAAVVGGGHLAEEIERRARELGWPLLRSYGMTEAASQIATQSVDEPGCSGDDWLPILPHCEVQAGVDGRLKIRGESVCEYYLDGNAASGYEIVAARDSGGWLETNDRGEVANERLRFLGRCDRTVKIFGELVDVDQVEISFRQRFDSALADAVFVEAFADERRGRCLVPIIVEGAMEPLEVASAIEEQNRLALPFERLEGEMWVNEVPRSSLGKIQRGELRRLARSR